MHYIIHPLHHSSITSFIHYIIHPLHHSYFGKLNSFVLTYQQQSMQIHRMFKKVFHELQSRYNITKNENKNKNYPVHDSGGPVHCLSTPIIALGKVQTVEWTTGLSCFAFRTSFCVLFLEGSLHF